MNSPFIINEHFGNPVYNEELGSAYPENTQQPEYYVDQKGKKFEVQTEYINFTNDTDSSLFSQKQKSPKKELRQIQEKKELHQIQENHYQVNHFKQGTEALNQQLVNLTGEMISQQNYQHQPVNTEQAQMSQQSYSLQVYQPPQQEAYAPQQQQTYVPQQPAFVPPQPQTYVPQQQTCIPQPQTYVPQQQTCIPQQQTCIPQQQVCIPQQQQMCIPQQQQNYQAPQQPQTCMPQITPQQPLQQMQYPVQPQAAMPQMPMMPMMQQPGMCFKCSKPKCRTNCLPQQQQCQEELQVIKGKTIYINRDEEGPITLQGRQACDEEIIQQCIPQIMIQQSNQLQACMPQQQPSCMPQQQQGCPPGCKPAPQAQRMPGCRPQYQQRSYPAPCQQQQQQGELPAPILLPTIYRTLPRDDEYGDCEEPMYRCNEYNQNNHKANYDALSNDLWSDYFYDLRTQNLRENNYDYGFSKDFIYKKCGQTNSRRLGRNRKCIDLPYEEFPGHPKQPKVRTESKNNIIHEAATMSKKFSQNPQNHNWPLDSKNIF